MTEQESSTSGQEPETAVPDGTVAGSEMQPAADQILATPTVVRHLPAPLRKVIGDLSDTGRVLVGLDIRPGTHS